MGMEMTMPFRRPVDWLSGELSLVILRVRIGGQPWIRGTEIRADGRVGAQASDAIARGVIGDSSEFVDRSTAIRPPPSP